MKLSYAIFYTNNIPQAKTFYTQQIGLILTHEDETFLTFAIGEGLLGIKKAELTREVPGHQTVIIEVENIDTWFKRAKEESWNIFSPLENAEWGKNFSILDPDKNRVEFFSEPNKNT